MSDVIKDKILECLRQKLPFDAMGVDLYALAGALQAFYSDYLDEHPLERQLPAELRAVNDPEVAGQFEKAVLTLIRRTQDLEARGVLTREQKDEISGSLFVAVGFVYLSSSGGEIQAREEAFGLMTLQHQMWTLDDIWQQINDDWLDEKKSADPDAFLTQEVPSLLQRILPPKQGGLAYTKGDLLNNYQFEIHIAKTPNLTGNPFRNFKVHIVPKKPPTISPDIEPEP